MEPGAQLSFLAPDNFRSAQGFDSNEAPANLEAHQEQFASDAAPR